MAKTTKKKDPTLTGYTAEKPSFMRKCIHTFKCMFNKDCEKLAKEELAEMSTKKALVDEVYEIL